LGQDTTLNAELRRQLNSDKNSLKLYFPKSVERFYSRTNFQPVWSNPQSANGQTWQAMAVLDNVGQFGLLHSDYHPEDLQYSMLHNILDLPVKVDKKLKVRFDILLTDALIAIMNHVHYGKLNPEFSAEQIDKGNNPGFRAEENLFNVLRQNPNIVFLTFLTNMQPRVKQYKDLQQQLRLLTATNKGDSDVMTKKKVRLIAINMERLRWADVNGANCIWVNIPSYTLHFYQPDTSFQFKVIVGKPATPTPTLNSAIAYFTTAPDWNVPQKIFRKELLRKAAKNIAYLDNSHIAIYDKNGKFVPVSSASLYKIRHDPGSYFARQSPGCDNALGAVVFRFPNPFDIYLHDTPEQQFFKKEDRAFSHGCIRVEQAEKLATLILKYDNAEDKIQSVHEAMAAYRSKTYTLSKSIPIRVTYLTCLVVDGEMVTYKDVYQLDNRLENAFYHTYQ
jgi:murein L,D-transpeptidase YcbB/YkuD